MFSMKGSIMDACVAVRRAIVVVQLCSNLVLRLLRMSEAVEGSELMLYGVSEKYKER